jgi:hypothetical protein
MANVMRPTLIVSRSVAPRVGAGSDRTGWPRQRGLWARAAPVLLAAAVIGCSGSFHSPEPSPSATPTMAASPIPTLTPTPTRAFTLTGSLITPRDGATATLLDDGRVLVTGGINPSYPETLASAEIYDPATGTFSPTGSMTAPRVDHSATLLRGGKVLIVGCEDADVYDPETGVFSSVGQAGLPGCNHTATRLADGKVLLAGGWDGRTYLRTAVIYDPDAGTFSPTGSMKVGRQNAQAVLLPDHRVLVIGGDQGDAGPDEFELASAEIYDPTAGTFAATGSMHIPRTHFGAILLDNGTVLVVGGSNLAEPGSDQDAATTAEIYDPATGKFSPTGSLSKPRSYCEAVGLLDGRVLVCGEIYDPDTGTFTPLAATIPAGAYPFDIPSVALRDGRVLFCGAPSLLYWP